MITAMRHSAELNEQCVITNFHLALLAVSAAFAVIFSSGKGLRQLSAACL